MVSSALLVCHLFVTLKLVTMVWKYAKIAFQPVDFKKIGSTTPDPKWRGAQPLSRPHLFAPLIQISGSASVYHELLHCLALIVSCLYRVYA